MKTFSTTWKSSTKPNKQRKYRFNAPLHIKGSFLNTHLSRELRQKYGIRALRLRVGDKVRIMRGQFKKQEGKIEEIDVRKTQVYVAKIEHTKKDGSKARYPIDPSNLLIIEITADDKKRVAKLDKTKTPAVPKATTTTTPAPAQKTVEKNTA
ncbi:MAG: 50S ribosomal protein L24 [Candidatus Woesearchaeota archaeon]